MLTGKTTRGPGAGGRGAALNSLPTSNPRPLTPARGFTLLELMIVISIIVILAMVVLPQYNKVVLQAREARLRSDLFEMRKLLDQYGADKGKMAQSLDELVSAGYLRDIPDDPMTDEPNWVVVMGEDPNSSDGGQGIADVCSASPDTSSEGTPYSDCASW